MFDNALDFIGKKLSQGLSATENGLSDAVHAVGHLFNGNSGPYTPPSQNFPIKTASSPISITNPQVQAQNQALSQASQPADPNNPVKINLTQPTPPKAPPPKAPPLTNLPISKAPSAGDVGGLQNSLQSIQNYKPDDQVRIIQRSAQAGIIPRNVAASVVGGILEPSPETDKSKWDMLGEAVKQSLLPGVSNLTGTIGTNLAARSLYNKALKGQIDNNIVNSVIGQAQAENGGIETTTNAGLPGSINTAKLVGNTLKAGTEVVQPFLGAGAALAERAGSPLVNVAKTSAKFGVGFGVPQGVGQTLTSDHPTPADLFKNIVVNIAQNAALPALTGGLTLGGKGLADKTIPLDEVGGKTPAEGFSEDIKSIKDSIKPVSKGLKDNLTPQGNEPFGKEDQAYLDEQLAKQPDNQAQIEKNRADLENTIPPKPFMTSNFPSLGLEEKRNLLSDPSQQTTNTVELTSKPGNTKGAIGEVEGIMSERDARFKLADREGQKLDLHDQKLLSERTDPNATIEPHNPEQFKKAAALYDDAFDYSLAADRASGSTTLRYGEGQYTPLSFRATPEKMDELGIPEEQRFKGKYTGFRDTTRKYRSYAEGDKVGLKPVRNSPIYDARTYAEQGRTPIRNNLLKEALKRTNPNDITDRGMNAVDENNRSFKQAGGGNLPFDVSEKLENALGHYKSAYQPKTAIGRTAFKLGTGAIRLSKKSLFLGTPFHYANETVRFGGATVLHPVVAIRGIGEALFSQGPTGYARILDKANKDGVVDWIRKSGTPFTESEGRGGIVRNAEGKVKVGSTLDPSRFMNRKLTEFGNTLTISLARFAKEHNIDPSSLEGTQLGAEYGKVIGRINEAVQGRDPTFQRLLSAGSLAPNWIETSFGLIKDAAKYSTVDFSGRRGVGLLNAGDVARGTVLGSRALLAAAAIIGSAIATGKFPTLKQAFNEAGLNLNNPVPNIEGNGKNKKGESVVQDFPTDPLGLAVMLFSDPQHFASSRYSPFLASMIDAITNKNWNGQPIADPNDPNFQVKRAVGAAKNLLPISVQNATNPNLSIKQGLLQDVGLRYKTNPNDPQAKANTAYFKEISNGVNNLRKSGPNGQYWANKFSSLHPSNTTDPTGTKYPTPYDPLSSEVKYDAYTMTDKNGNRVLSPVWYEDQKLSNMTKGYPSPPIYKLNGTGTDVGGNQAPQALVAMEYQHAQTAGQKTVIMTANGGQNGWLGQYEQQVGDYSKNYQANLTSYFKSLGWTSAAINDYWTKHPSSPDPIDQVTFDQHTTDIMNQYYALDASNDPTAATQFFSANADVLGNAFDQLAVHANALRTAKGELQTQGYPNEPANVKAILASMPQGADKASKTARFNLINQNADVRQYLADVSLYENLSKGAQFMFKNPSNMSATEGQNINAGGAAGQSFLKSTSSLGQYDIGKNAQGQYAFMQGGSLPEGFTAGGAAGRGGKSSKSKIVPFPKRTKIKTVKIRRAPKQRKTRVKLARQQRPLHLTQTATLKPVRVARPTSVVKVGS